MQPLTVRHVDKRLVHAEYLDIRTEPRERTHDAGRDFRVHPGPGRALDQVGAKRARLVNTHAGPDATGARLVGTGNKGGADRAVGNTDGPAAQLGEIPALDRCKKCVHVDVDDGARPIMLGFCHVTSPILLKIRDFGRVRGAEIARSGVDHGSQ